jgi:hypothetical protein
VGAMSQPTLKVTADFTKEFNQIIQKFKGEQVLVGIPAEDSNRDKQEGDTSTDHITNAALLAINNFGSEEAGIPARPVMEIGIRKAQDAIAEEFKKAAQNALSKGFAAIDTYYERAGSIAANSVKKVINDQEDIEGPSDATLVIREREGFKGEKSLIRTGQMRNAITYVVKGKT